jgi:hypothetical protein
MEKHEIAAILSDTRYYIQNDHGDRFYLECRGEDPRF